MNVTKNLNSLKRLYIVRISSGSSARAWSTGGGDGDTVSMRSTGKAESGAADTDELIETEVPGKNGCWASCSKSVGGKQSFKRVSTLTVY